jgi:endonuclease/exonuclease/phosphatase family metal-dependent hydrolase
LAVLARPPYALESQDSPEPFFISSVITGPERFRFVGFWGMTPTYAKYEYPAQATLLIQYLPDDELPTVVAGDFNASKSTAHLRNVESLRARGLVSAYHAIHQVPHDAIEEHPTSYHLWNQGRPFHMDFVFVPLTWHIESVEVGTFEDYVERRLSDHVPVVVTLQSR